MTVRNGIETAACPGRQGVRGDSPNNKPSFQSIAGESRQREDRFFILWEAFYIPRLAQHMPKQTGSVVKVRSMIWQRLSALLLKVKLL